MNGGREDKERGIVPRSVDLIFETLKKYQDDGILTNDTKVTMSCLEIYKEAVHELLSAEQVGSPADVQAWIEESQQRRVTAATDLNQQSSRSHCIYQLSVTARMVAPTSTDATSGK